MPSGWIPLRVADVFVRATPCRLYLLLLLLGTVINRIHVDSRNRTASVDFKSYWDCDTAYLRLRGKLMNNPQIHLSKTVRGTNFSFAPEPSNRYVFVFPSRQSAGGRFHEYGDGLLKVQGLQASAVSRDESSSAEAAPLWLGYKSSSDLTVAASVG